MSAERILMAPMPPNDADAKTVKDYLKALLSELWREEEGFNGKRPFGNSGWQFDVYFALVRAHVIDGKIQDGDLIEVDQKHGDAMIQSAIAAL